MVNKTYFENVFPKTGFAISLESKGVHHQMQRGLKVPGRSGIGIQCTFAMPTHAQAGHMAAAINRFMKSEGYRGKDIAAVFDAPRKEPDDLAEKSQKKKRLRSGEDIPSQAIVRWSDQMAEDRTKRKSPPKSGRDNKLSRRTDTRDGAHSSIVVLSVSQPDNQELVNTLKEALAEVLRDPTLTPMTWSNKHPARITGPHGDAVQLNDGSWRER